MLRRRTSPSQNRSNSENVEQEHAGGRGAVRDDLKHLNCETKERHSMTRGATIASKEMCFAYRDDMLHSCVTGTILKVDFEEVRNYPISIILKKLRISFFFLMVDG